MDSLTDIVPLVISLVSLLGAAYSFTYTRKTFIFSVCTERAKEVRFLWQSKTKLKGHSYITEDTWQYWSNIVSEIVASIIIIDKLADSWKVLRSIYSVDDFYIIFWQQIPTDLRTAIEGYETSSLDSLNDEQKVFKKQMKTILKTYKK